MNRPLFQLFGIPVTVDAWFLLTLVLFYQLAGGGSYGLHAAAAVAVFVLIHELGHAATARHFGAETEIRLSFLMGWASYVTRQPLKRWQANAVSAAGPMAQLLAAVAALAVLRQFTDPFDPTPTAVGLYSAISWAGVILAVLNLMPLWPLDGGHIVASLLPDSARRGFLQWTVGASVVMAILGFGIGPGPAIENWAGSQQALAFFDPLPIAVGRLLIAAPAVAAASTLFIPLFCALSAYQSLQTRGAGRPWTVTNPVAVGGPPLQVQQAVTTAERQGWMTGTPAAFPRGWGPSPWLTAELSRRAGATPAEISVVLASLATDRPRWMVDRLDRPEIANLLTLVPPLAARSPETARARVFHGDAQSLIDASLAAFHGDAAAEGFYLIAEGLAERGETDLAMQWLAGAVERAPSPRRVATSPHFRPYHGHHEFQQILGAAERAALR